MSGLSTRLPFMKAMEKTLIGLANLQCRWRKPSFIGDTLHIELEVIEKKPSHKPDRGTVILSRKAIDQNGEVVLESEWSLVLKRETAAV
jgi:acyl dehydratase